MQKQAKWIGIVLVVVLTTSLAALPALAQEGGESAGPGFLGIYFRAGDDGVLVRWVVPGSPAEDAGLTVRDVITALNGDAVDAETFAEAMSAFAPGDVVTLTVQGIDGETQDVDVTLAEQPESTAGLLLEGRGRAYLGVSLSEAEGQVIISDVAGDSPAAEAGLQAGDVIATLDGADVTDARQFVAAIRRLDDGSVITLGIERDGEAQDVDVTLAVQETPVFDRFGLANDSLSITIEDGALVINELSEDHALYAAGLQPGDVITGIEGTMDFMLLFGGEGLQDVTLTMTVDRDGETLTIEVAMLDLMPLGMMGMMPLGDHLPFMEGMMEGMMPGFGGRGDGRGAGNGRGGRGGHDGPFGGMFFGDDAFGEQMREFFEQNFPEDFEFDGPFGQFMDEWMEGEFEGFFGPGFHLEIMPGAGDSPQVELQLDDTVTLF